jgi:outer membrane protein OmpA-like peptidoglycan-associated protein
MKYFITLLLFVAFFAQAEQFQAPITDTQWLVSASPLECSMTQEIALYGRAQFTQSPGKEFSLSFNSPLYPSKQTDIHFEIAQAPWQNSEDRLLLTSLQAEKNQQTFTITGKVAKQAFTYIKEGMFPTIRYLSQNSIEEISVLLSTVHFRDSQLAFVQCVEQLFPYTFEQIHQLTVHFNSEQSMLTDDAKIALTRIADYVKIDNSNIKQIKISGHTDNHGRKRLNIPLAQARAMAVKKYLIEECEIPEKLITTSWHREFIAATTNKTASGRAQNRRAEIELIR